MQNFNGHQLLTVAFYAARITQDIVITPRLEKIKMQFDAPNFLPDRMN